MSLEPQRQGKKDAQRSTADHDIKVQGLLPRLQQLLPTGRIAHGDILRDKLGRWGNVFLVAAGRVVGEGLKGLESRPVGFNALEGFPRTDTSGSRGLRLLGRPFHDAFRHAGRRAAIVLRVCRADCRCSVFIDADGTIHWLFSRDPKSSEELCDKVIHFASFGGGGARLRWRLLRRLRRLPGPRFLLGPRFWLLSHVLLLYSCSGTIDLFHRR